MYWLFPLSSDLSGMVPEHRFFLTIFLYKFGINSYAQAGMKELSAEFKLRKGVVSNSLNYLKSVGFLIHEKVPTGGRPANTYICSKLLNDRVRAWSRQNESPLHADQIGCLLADQENTFWLHLKFPVRLLYLMLISRSDEFGLVRNLGISALAEMIGITGTRVSSYLESLKKAGFIKFSIPGFWSNSLYGKVNSVYQLQINGRSIYPQNFAYEYITIQNYDVAERIFGLAKYMCIDMVVPYSEIGVYSSIPKFRLEGICKPNFLYIAPLLCRPSSQLAMRYMQFKIEECANYFLNEKLQAIESPSFTDPLLIKRIKDDCFPARVGANWGVNGDFIPTEILVDCIFRSSLELAREIVEYKNLKRKYRVDHFQGASSKLLFFSKS